MSQNSSSSCHFDKSMEFFYNRSDRSNLSYNILTLVQVVGSIFCTFILVANCMVIAAVITNKRFHYPFYYLLANLAASDFLAGIAYVYLMFNAGDVSPTLTIGEYFFRQGLLDVSLSASLANLLVIALERYISVMNWKVHSNLTKRRVTLLIFLVWSISILMGAVPSLGWNCICDLDNCSKMAPIFSRSYLIFWSVSNLVIFAAMVAIYTRIYIYVKKKTVMLMSNTNSSINRRRTPIKLIKTVMVVLGAFVICWTPGLVVMLLDGMNCEKCDFKRVKSLILLLAVANSVMNPCIYSYKDRRCGQLSKTLCVASEMAHGGSGRHANARPLNSGQDTNTSPPPSDEIKSDNNGSLDS